MGWAIQAAAIEVASKDGFKKNPARSEWKNALTQEILKALDSNPNHRLPGVTAYYRIPYQGHTDQYSHNRVTVRFIGLRGVESDWFLHVGTDYSALFNSAGDIATLGLLKNCKGMDESTTFWLADLFNELTLLNGIYKETPSPNIERLISKRFRLIKGILEDYPNASDNLDIIYQRENFHDRFNISVQNEARISLASITIGPEEVESKMWNLFREACIKRYPNAIVPRIHTEEHQRRNYQRDRRPKRRS